MPPATASCSLSDSLAASQISKWVPIPSSITSRVKPTALRNSGETRIRPAVSISTSQPGAGRHRPGGDLLAVRFPHRAREKQQAAVGVLGQRQAAFALNGERVTVLGRDGHPAFSIEIDRGSALKHGVPDFENFL
jgi:hypothetical protein